MGSNETTMSEMESMQLITSMINKAKNRFNESGFLYLLWGWIVLCCCIVQFVAGYFLKIQNAYYVWCVTWAVLIYQIFFLRKKRKARKVKIYTDDINKFIWIVFGICSVLLAFILIQLKKFDAINPAILVMYGMPTFLSGIILKFRPLVIGAIFCWAFSLVSLFINMDFQVLLIAGALISGWIIPGYLLKAKFKNEK